MSNCQDWGMSNYAKTTAPGFRVFMDLPHKVRSRGKRQIWEVVVKNSLWQKFTVSEGHYL